MNLLSYADRLAMLAAELHLDLALILADGAVDAAEFPRLVALSADLPALINGLDYLAAHMALAGQLLRRGPDDPTPDKYLRRRLADLAAHENAPAGLQPTGALDEPGPPQLHEGHGSCSL